MSSNYTIQITANPGTLPSRSTSLWNAALWLSIFHSHPSRTNFPGRIFLLSFVYNFPAAKKSD
jgi:hypothetical protein